MSTTGTICRTPAAALLALLVLGLGCDERLKRDHCEQDPDCGDGRRCELFRCVAVDRSDAGRGDGRSDGTSDGRSDGPDGDEGNGPAPVVDGPVDLPVPDAAGTCAADGDCTGADRFCAAGVCVACTANAHCTDPTRPFCAGNRCVGCAMAPEGQSCGALQPERPVCLPATGACAQCLDAAHCTTPGKGFCVDNACVGCGAAGAGACKGPNPVCDSASGLCVECTAPSHCGVATRPFCAGNKCVGCDMAPMGQSCATLTPATPVCGAGGACLECNASADCQAPNRPICQASKCVACTADAQCAARPGGGPGICLDHLDGRCATEAETIHVRAGSCGNGSMTQPACSLEAARPLISATRRLVLVRGLVGGFSWSLPSGGPVTVVGQQQAVIAGGAVAGARLSGTGELWLRDLSFTSSAVQGIVAEQGVNLRGDRLLIEGNRGGGLLLDRARFHLRDVVVNDNGPGQQSATAWGGILVQSPPAGGARLERVTITSNRQIGLSCTGPIQGTAVLATGNVGGDIAPTCAVGACTTPGPSCGAVR